MNARDVNLIRTGCVEEGVGPGCGGITTSYWEAFNYGYDATIANVQVDITDDGEWLQWTYTYAASPTHTPKMTVAIDYSTGFAITTFDDGSHDGWYYAIDGGATTRLGNYSGITKDWVETTASGNVLTVRIKKSVLNDTFKWHGYANYNGLGVWINDQESGTGYEVNQFIVTIREELVNPVTVPAESSLDFVIKSTILSQCSRIKAKAIIKAPITVAASAAFCAIVNAFICFIVA